METHQGQRLLRQGPEPGNARALLILLHGRGSAASEIMGVGPHFPHDGLALAAPQAEGNSWFPYSFLAPLEQNEPGITSAMDVIAGLITEADLSGLPPSRVMILGFSQGACLALEFAARHPGRYGGIYSLSGGLIGPPGTRWENLAGLSGTPVFIGCSDADPHIPRSRVEESGRVLSRLGGDVTVRLYAGTGHTISDFEIVHVNAMIARVMAAGAAATGAAPDPATKPPAS